MDMVLLDVDQGMITIGGFSRGAKGMALDAQRGAHLPH